MRGQDGSVYVAVSLLALIFLLVQLPHGKTSILVTGAERL